MAGDFVKDAISASAQEGRQPMGTSAYDDIQGYHASQYTKLVAKMNRQSQDPALMPHTAPARVLSDEPYGGGTGGVRVNMTPKSLDPAAGKTLASSKLLHPSMKRSASFEQGGEG